MGCDNLLLPVHPGPLVLALGNCRLGTVAAAAAAAAGTLRPLPKSWPVPSPATSAHRICSDYKWCTGITPSKFLGWSWWIEKGIGC
ncbi:hypothetical protein U9M48_036851 [Paspalum notatum var. saurae]|uniref:Uncharacterized protein n=1 Tax=Paspalum notatum var. saurae TaxID=547442 RepID=A0AAQ3X8N3_PASNO